MHRSGLDADGSWVIISMVIPASVVARGDLLFRLTSQSECDEVGMASEVHFADMREIRQSRIRIKPRGLTYELWLEVERLDP